MKIEAKLEGVTSTDELLTTTTYDRGDQWLTESISARIANNRLR